MSDNTTDATILILRDIQARLTKLETLPTEVSALRRELRDDIAVLRGEMVDRHNAMISIFGGAHRDHERRITYLEERMERVDPPPTPRRRR